MKEEYTKHFCGNTDCDRCLNTDLQIDTSDKFDDTIFKTYLPLPPHLRGDSGLSDGYVSTYLNFDNRPILQFKSYIHNARLCLKDLDQLKDIHSTIGDMVKYLEEQTNQKGV